MAGRKPVVSDRDILRQFQQSDDPVLSAPEIAEGLRIGDTGTYQRLRELQDDELVASKKVGQGRAWWITEAGEQYLADELDADDLERDDE